ncbi:uroporphyrinogen-III synthase isoform X2 [Aplysia californica]|uniref:Uroporphyrinogen-III synthase isoform X2 n=1 Tax=Aplysia californica TaxID=6500 RepID=A0ABM0JNX9_APLCA|nr:uroporphyrinogen-III synthase isoform X2 [Aplysia californica]
MGDSGKPGNRCVFLFKSPKENETDKYSEVLTSAGFSPVVVPVLSFKFCNETALQTHVAALHLFSAVIFTSTRAVEAVLSVSTGELSRFADITCFVVGQATALAAKKAGFVPTGEETGNAEVLSQLIIKCRDPQDKRPMLFPCSSLRRDTLPDSLSKHDISLTEVVAYETCPNEELQDVLLKSFENYGTPEYAVFFSPSCFQFVHQLVTPETLPLDKVKIIALGPSVNKAVREHGYEPYAVAAKPEPQSLLQVLS